jgi:hypothetical protein
MSLFNACGVSFWLILIHVQLILVKPHAVFKKYDVNQKNPVINKSETKRQSVNADGSIQNFYGLLKFKSF